MENYIAFDTIKSLALKAGFQDCGAIEIKKFDISFLKNWIDRGYNADMQYLERYIDIRENPSLLLENSKSVVRFIVSYNIELPDNKDDNILKFASYSLFNDYHKAIKQALYELIHCIQDIYPNFKAIAFVDSAPILEKVIAKEAGLGWIGKNSLLINKTFGSKILIGEIITNFSTDYSNELEKDLCKECSTCISSCPNQSIQKNNTINANLCNSYQTIENKNNIPENIKKQRLAVLDGVLTEINREFNESCIGKTMKCLIEGPDKTGKYLLARSPYMQQVIIPNESDDKIQNIEITAANKCSLRGKIAKN